MRYDQLKVLLVDDNAHARMLLREILKAVGVREIHEAADGAEGLKLLQAHRVDVVITDLAMTPMDGLSFVRRLRRSPNSPNQQVAIVMITGHATKQRVAEARDVGISEFLAKPLTSRGVLERLQTAVQRPREFLQVDGFVGPDRRRRREPQLADLARREADLAGSKVETGGS